jgi:CDP-6-deoxy-D-xylo-4-hexulose-3-dehydrase
VPGRTPVRYAGRVYDEHEMVNLVSSSLEFWLTAGRWHRRLEADLARWYGLAHARLVNSGSSANLLAVAALTSPRWGERRLRPGDEVITVAAGFPTTVAPMQLGMVPVFVDITLPTYNVDVARLGAGALPAHPGGDDRPHPRQPLRPRRRVGLLPRPRALAHRGQLRRLGLR